MPPDVYSAFYTVLIYPIYPRQWTLLTRAERISTMNTQKESHLTIPTRKQSQGEGKPVAKPSTVLTTQRELRHPNQNEKLLALHNTMQSITGQERLRFCHTLHDGMLFTSCSIWGSPLSAVRIADARRAMIARAMRNWISQKGHSMEVMSMDLEYDTPPAPEEAWVNAANALHSFLNTASWRGGAGRKGDKQTFGVEHYVKTFSITYGEHDGWRVTVDFLMFLNHTCDEQQLARMEKRFGERWERQALRHGARASSLRVGREVRKSTLGAYMTRGALTADTSKLNDTNTPIGLSGRRRTPFQILSDISASSDLSINNPDIALWWEWEDSALGHRHIGWSVGAKETLGIADMDDSLRKKPHHSKQPKPGKPATLVSMISTEEDNKNSGVGLSPFSPVFMPPVAVDMHHAPMRIAKQRAPMPVFSD